METFIQYRRFGSVPKTIKNNLTGQRFGRLLVLGFYDIRTQRSRWMCLCDCGHKRPYIGTKLACGNAKSCGCGVGISNTKRAIHGLYRSPIYQSWGSMLERCRNPNFVGFKDYGGRGIKVCNHLHDSVENLLSLIGNRPEGTTLDRIDVNGNYSCGSCQQCKTNNWGLNVRWATTHAQARNRRNNVFLTHNGKTLCVADWAKEFKVDPKYIRNRLYKGVSPEEVFLLLCSR